MIMQITYGGWGSIILKVSIIYIVHILKKMLYVLNEEGSKCSFIF